jgi:hypothetical protein
LPDLTALPSLRRPEPRRLLRCHLSSDICVWEQFKRAR